MRDGLAGDRSHGRPPYGEGPRLSCPIVLWKYRGEKKDLRGLVFVTSVGYAFGLELATELIWFHLQPSLERLVDIADGWESKLLVDGWKPMDAELFLSGSESRHTGGR
jgi:hypothetical protein